jgi:cyclic pyranopterin phosphate synthase
MYCMPEDKQEGKHHIKTAKFLKHTDLLSYEELVRVVTLAVSLGMNKLRLTGGEPLVRKGVIHFIKRLRAINGLEQIRLTTNGLLLEEYAADLYNNDVRHINVSLDSLRKDKFKTITGRDRFDQVWKGLLKAEDMGFKIKVNVVAMNTVNDDEFLDFAQLALDHKFQVRFIEFMPIGEKDSWSKKHFIQADEIRKRIEPLGVLTAFEGHRGAGPARMFRLESDSGKSGSVGFISPISHHFCDKCNRLRLTSEGHLRACLLKDTETDLKALLRSGATDEQIVESIRQTILNKPKGHSLDSELDVEEKAKCGGAMSRIGG